MEKKTIVVIAFAIITLTGMMNLNASTQAEITSPISISNLDYLEYEYVLIGSTQEVNLSFVTSEYDQSAVTITKVNYYPAENETKYQISSNHITPDHTFTPGVKAYLYQDENTGQIYQVNIDYNTISPPQSPTEIQLNILQNQYDNLLANYTLLQNESMNYTSLIQELNNTLTEYNDSTLVTLQQKTMQLYQDYQEYYDDYQEYYTKYTALKDDHDTLTSQKSELQNMYHNLTTTYNQLNNSYQEVNNTLNQTKQNLTSTQFNLSKYEAFARNLRGTGTQAYLGVGDYEGWYTTPYFYDEQIQELENANGMIPLFIIVSIAITALCFIIFMSIYIKKLRVGPMEYDQMKYLPTSQKYDNFLIEKAMNLTKHITNAGKGMYKKGKRIISKKPQQEENLTRQSNTTEPKHEMNDKIDRLLAGVSSVRNDMGTVKEDITGIHSTIDEFGTRIEKLEKKKPSKSKSRAKATPA